MRTEFVDRVDDMAALVDELVDGRGGALVIEGLSGMTWTTSNAGWTKRSTAGP